MRTTWARRLAVGALVVPVGLGGCAGGDGDGEDGAPRPPSGDEALVTLVVASGGPLAALRAERTVAASAAVLAPAGAGGATPLLGEDAPDVGTARQRADDAVAAFEEVLARSDHPGAEPYRRAIAGWADVEALRAGLDAQPAAASLSDESFARATAAYAAYDAVVTPVLDATADVATAVEDPGLRRGVELYGLGQRQVEAAAGLAVTLPGVLGAEPTPEELTAIAALERRLADGRAAAADLATGTDYEPAATALEADLAAVGFVEPVTAWVAGGGAGPLDMSATLASLDPPGGGWAAFVTDVERRLLA